MQEKDLVTFFKSGWNPYINPNETEHELLDRLNIEPDEAVGDSNGKYLYYGIYRFGIRSDGIVNEFGIDIRKKNNAMIPIFIELTDETFILSEKTLLHEFIFLLNYLNIPWSMFGGKPGIPPNIKTDGGVAIVFDAYEGDISLINKILD